MRRIQTTVAGRVLSVALSGALLLGNLGAGAGVAAASTAPPTAADPAQLAPSMVREIPEHRTERSREYLLSNGSVRVLYFAESVNYRDAATNRLLPIDTSLDETTSAGAAVSVNRANRFRLELPRDLSRDEVSFEASGTRVTLRPEWKSRAGEAAPGSGDIRARSVSATERAYQDAFAGATLDYISLADGLKETIVLSKPGGANVFGFAMRLDGLTPRIEPDRSITLLSADTGQAVLTIPAPFMMDSSGSTIGSDYSNAVHYEISGTGPLYHLDVVADATWLSDPARVYPVRIDPSVLVVNTTLASAQDTFISSAGANQGTNYVTHPLVWVNYHDPGAYWTEEGYVQPSSTQISDMATKKGNGYQVVTSYLKEALGSGNIANSGSVTALIEPTSTAVYLNNITWNAQPPSALSTMSSAAVNTVAGWNNFDVTKMTAYWQSAGTAYRYATLELAPSLQTHVGYNAADVTSGSKPVWEIDYAKTPTVTVSSPTSGSVTSIPSASWTMTDTGTGFTQAEWALEVATSSAGPAIASTGAANAATTSALPTPAGGWIPGTTYWVRVKAATSPSTQTPRLWSTWSTGNFTPTLPSAVSELSYTTTASLNWFTEIDSNGDGVNDAPDDAADYGRGSVTLSWPAATGATSYKVFMHDGNTYRQVGTATSTTWSSAGKGIFPSDSQIASLSANTTANPLPPGTGLDLRDDPRGLYAKTGGSSLDATAVYQFKVVAANGAGECASASPEVLAVLDNRTLHVNDAPNHSNVDLTAMLGHDAAVELDAGALTLSATDLEIASWGPRAALDRYYSSDVSSSPSFAPGWRFGFERSLSVSGTSAVYTDEYGDTYRYRASGPLWVSGMGDYSTLATSIAGATITTKERSVLSFDIAGRLISEADANGNTVTYTRGEDLTITAANGQSIVVDRDGAGTVLSATYSTAAGTRRVDYATSPTAKVTYSYAPTSAVGYSVSLGYAGGRLTSLACTESGTNWSVTYGSGTTSVTVENTSGDGSPSYRRTVSRNAASRTATVATFDATQTFTWNPSVTLVSKSNPGAPAEVTSWRYSPSNDQIEERSPEGRLLRTSYDVRGNVVADTDAVGIATRYAYDGLDRCIWQRDPRGSETSRTYDARGNLLAEERTVASGGLPARSEWTYDASGRTTSERSRIDTSTWAETTYADFASNGSARVTTRKGVKLTSSGAAQDLVESGTFDEFGDELTRTDALGVTAATNTFDPSGRTLTSTDASGVVANTSYDALGRGVSAWRSHPSTSTRPDWSENHYDAVGNAVTVTRRDSSGTTVSTVASVFDDLGRRLTSDDSRVAGKLETEYDSQGRTTHYWTEGSNTANEAASSRSNYDADGNETASFQPGATTSATVSTLDQAGRTLSEQGPDGLVTNYVYDDAGDTVEEAVPSDDGTATTSTQYALDGEPVTVTAPNGVATTQVRDLLGRTIATRSGDQTASTTTYNALGWVLTQTDFDGITKSFAYDAAGRIVSDSVSSLTTLHVFDATGREVYRSNPDGSGVTRVYDQFGRVVTETATGSDGQCANRFAYSYDSHGRVVGRTELVSGASARYAYSADGWVTLTETRRGNTLVSTIDSTGLLRSVDGTLSGAHVDWSVTATDTAGRVVGGTSATFVNDWTIGYDQAGRVIHPSEVNGGIPKWGTYVLGGPQSVPAWGVNYVYSPTTGKKVSEDLQFNSGRYVHSAYVYDLNGRVASATVGASSTAYGYDAVSGALSTVKPSGQPTISLAYSGLGRLTSVGSRNYVSDSIGRRTWAGPSGNPSETAYSWSGERLTGLRSAGATAAYVYDASGQRTQSVVTSGSLVTTATFDYDGLRLLGLSVQRSDGSTWSVDYVYDERGVVFAGTYRASDATPVAFLMVASDRGDVRELIDVTGRSFAHYEYDVYGNPTQKAVAGTLADWNPSGIDTSTASAITSRQVLRYAGYAFDEHSGMYYCSQRYYDPASYQFISRDPARADGENSAYQYCGGDPVGTVDPSGLFRLIIEASPGDSAWGHAWLRIYNSKARPSDYPKHLGVKISFRGISIYPKMYMTVGWWPSDKNWVFGGGVKFNMEPEMKSLDDRLGLSVKLPDSKLAKLNEYVTNHKDQYSLRSPCTWHAVAAWNTVATPQIKNKHWKTGGWLYKRIREKGGKKIGWGKPGDYRSDLTRIDP